MAVYFGSGSYAAPDTRTVSKTFATELSGTSAHLSFWWLYNADNRAGAGGTTDIFTAEGSLDRVILRYTFTPGDTVKHNLRLRIDRRSSSGGSFTNIVNQVILNDTSLDANEFFLNSWKHFSIILNPSSTNRTWQLRYGSYDRAPNTGIGETDFKLIEISGSYSVSGSDYTLGTITLNAKTNSSGPVSSSYGNGFDRLYVDVRDTSITASNYYSPSTLHHKFYQAGDDGDPYVGYSARLGSNGDGTFPDGTPYINLYQSGSNFGINDVLCDGEDFDVAADAISISGPPTYALTIANSATLSSTSTITSSGDVFRQVTTTLESNSALIATAERTQGLLENLQSTFNATDFSGVEDYVGTDTSVLYVDANYYNPDYALNDPYVEQGYMAEEIGLSAEVQINAQSTILSAGNISVDATASLASEVSLSTQTNLSASAGLLMSESFSLVSQTTSTQTAINSIFNNVELSSEFVTAQLAGLAISADLNTLSNASVTAEPSLTVGAIPAEILAETIIDVTPGYALDAAASLEVQTDISALPNQLINETVLFFGNTQLSATAGIVQLAQGVLEGNFTQIANAENIITDVVNIMSNSFTVIETSGIIHNETALLVANTDTSALAGLQFDEQIDLNSELTLSGIARNSIGSSQGLVVNSTISSFGKIFIGLDADLNSNITVTPIVPRLFVGSNVILTQSITTVVTEGSYLFDVPQFRRLMVPYDRRIGNILQETRIFNLKSDTRINTVLTETRTLRVPKNSRTHKIYDGSL